MLGRSILTVMQMRQVKQLHCGGLRNRVASTVLHLAAGDVSFAAKSVATLLAVCYRSMSCCDWVARAKLALNHVIGDCCPLPVAPLGECFSPATSRALRGVIILDP